MQLKGPAPAERARDELEAENERLRRELAAERARTDALLSWRDVGLCFVDAELRYVRVNERLARLNGRSVADHVGRTVAEVVPAFWPMLEPLLRQALRGEPFQGELAFVTGEAPGERSHFRASYLPVRAGEEILGIAGAIEDVTATRAAERRLRVLAKTSRVITQSELDQKELLPALAHVVSEELDVACGVVLRDPDGLLGPVAVWHGDAEMRTVFERHVRAFRPRVGEGIVGRVVTTGEPVLFPVLDPALPRQAWRPEDRGIHERYPIRSLAVVPLRIGGVIDGALAVARYGDGFEPLTGDDLSLLGEIADRAGLAIDNAREHEESARARLAAEAASRAKDEFVAMLGHELRNPLAPILTALRIMRMRDVGGERERAIIERQAQHLVRLVDDLLDISRIARGAVTLERERVELGAVVARALEMAEPLLAGRAHHLAVEVPTAGLAVDADPTRLAQVVSNLLTNAAKYTERGGRITVAARRDGGDVVLTVRDTGIGIDAEMLPRVFDAFVQERQALDRARGGLGLGLAIVRSLVERHGGTVAARSEGRGRGSEFEVRLPAATGTAGAPAAAPPPGRAPGAGRRVLIVDDNEDAADLLAELLSAQGDEVRVAYDGPQALQAVEGFTPDVALLDIGLPAMDGYELARRLRERPELAGLRLVAVSGYGQGLDRRRSAEAGFAAHLVKPVALPTLLSAMDPVRSDEPA